MKDTVITSINPEYEKHLAGGRTFTSDDIKEGLDSLFEIEQQYEDGAFEDIRHEIDVAVGCYNDHNLDAAVSLTAVAKGLGINVEDIKEMRLGPDNDLFAVTLEDSSTKYFFDHGALYKGVNDADTGEVYYYSF